MPSDAAHPTDLRDQLFDAGSFPMSKSASMSTDTLKVKGKKQKSQIMQAMVEALYRFNPRALLGSPILFTLWLAAVMASVESLLGQPVSGVAPSLRS